MFTGTTERTLMIETVAKEVDEKTIKRAMRLAQAHVGEIITQQQELQRQIESVQRGARRGEECIQLEVKSSSI